MEFQLAILLYIYLAFIAVFLFFTFFNIYHVLHFGFSSLWAYFLTFTYTSVSIIALVISFIYIMEIDWSQTITILNNQSSIGL